MTQIKEVRVWVNRGRLMREPSSACLKYSERRPVMLNSFLRNCLTGESPFDFLMIWSWDSWLPSKRGMMCYLIWPTVKTAKSLSSIWT